ncbi:MAG: hypothetical protein QXU54_03270 [Candidatus Micrarchaeia archaeon]
MLVPKKISEVSEAPHQDAVKRASIFSKFKEKAEHAFDALKEKSKAALATAAIAVTLTVSCGGSTTHGDNEYVFDFLPASDEDESHDSGSVVPDVDNMPTFGKCSDPLYPQEALSGNCIQIGILNEKTFSYDYRLEDSIWYPKPTVKGLKKVCFDFESDPSLSEETKESLRKVTVLFSNNPLYGVDILEFGYGYHTIYPDKHLYPGEMSISNVYADAVYISIVANSFYSQKSEGYVKPAGWVWISDPFDCIDYTCEDVFVLCSFAGVGPQKWSAEPGEWSPNGYPEWLGDYIVHMIVLKGNQYMGLEGIMKE